MNIVDHDHILVSTADAETYEINNGGGMIASVSGDLTDLIDFPVLMLAMSYDSDVDQHVLEFESDCGCVDIFFTGGLPSMYKR